MKFQLTYTHFEIVINKSWPFCSSLNMFTHCGQGTQILVKMGSINRLLPDCTKPIAEPIFVSSNLFCGIHLRAILLMLMDLIANMCQDITLLKLPPHFSGANELIPVWWCSRWITVTFFCPAIFVFHWTWLCYAVYWYCSTATVWYSYNKIDNK